MGISVFCKNVLYPSPSKSTSGDDKKSKLRKTKKHMFFNSFHLSGSLDTSVVLFVQLFCDVHGQGHLFCDIAWDNKLTNDAKLFNCRLKLTKHKVTE